MSQSLSLFNELKRGGYDTCLITTFSIDFPFYEDVLLRRMKTAGIHHHVVLADQSMCIQAIGDRPPRMAGRHYTLATMACAGAFHPKVLLLLGKNKGLLAIGSHNLTLAGFGTNLEVTNVLRFNTKENTEHLGLFQRAVEALRAWLKEYGEHLPAEIRASTDKLETLYPWLDDDSTQDDIGPQLLYTSKSTASLWQQAQPFLPDAISRVVGISPFFDKELAFLQNLAEISRTPLQIGVQPDQVQGPKTLTKQPDVKLINSTDLIPESKYAGRYIHAKMLFLKGKNDTLLMSGSANFSTPAWLDGPRRNAEAILLREDAGVQTVFDELGYNALLKATAITTLPIGTQPPEQMTGPSTPLLLLPYIHGARLEIPKAPNWQGALSLGYEGEYGEVTPIVFENSKDRLIVLPKALSHPGEPISIFKSGAVIARLIVHDVRRIQEQSSTGTERKVRQAIGSLASDSPDIALLFDCMSRLTSGSDAKKAGKAQSSSGGKSALSVKGDTPETLLTDISEHVLNTASGRPRYRAQDEIGLILDTLMASIRIEHKETEEDVEQDGVDIFQSGEEDDPTTDALDKSTPKQESIVLLAARCRSRLTDVIRKLEKYLETVKVEGLSAALGVCIIAYQLFKLKGEEGLIDKTHLAELFAVFTRTILDDKDPLYSSSGPKSVFHSEDWGKFLGYVTWLAYYAGVNAYGRPPVSTTLDERNVGVWRCACWLYLIQRLKADNDAKAEAADLVSSLPDEKLSLWFSAISANHSAKTKQLLPQVRGYMLAHFPDTAPKKAFPGYRLAVESDNRVSLASIAHPGKTNQFQAGFVSLVS